jgi:acetate kinase
VLVLVINSGSSSLKYQLRDVGEADGGQEPEPAVLAEGLIERIGFDGGPRDHAEALGQVDAELHRVLGGRAVDAVGHRVVHGGERFSEPVLVNNEIIRAIERLNPLAPLHNPANVLGLRAIASKWPDMPQAAVFDTAYHRSIPEHAWRYAVPDWLYTHHGIRRYGFHGTSHQYVAGRAAELMGIAPEEFDGVVLHLGNGVSATAVQGGESIDTSMGFTPLEGLVMGTRSGDIDPAILDFVSAKEGLTLHELDSMLNKQSGLLGLSGLTADMRELLAEESEHEDRRARLAVDLFCYRVKKYLGAYLAAMNGADAIVFAGGIGENSPEVRTRICAGMDWLGITPDPSRNAALVGSEGRIDAADSRVELWVIPTDEELLIARDTWRVVTGEELQ